MNEGTIMPKELDAQLHRQITALCGAGDELANRDRHSEAISKYEEAWALLPDPKEQWETTLWIRSSIGDAYFFKGDYLLAAAAFAEAATKLGGLGNPFVHLRMGECHYELGDVKGAADELTRAYMGAGRNIFEKEDPKYLKLLNNVLQPPPGQDHL